MVFLEVLLWAVFFVLIIMTGASYFLNTDITASIKGLFSNNPTVDIIVDSEDVDSEDIERYSRYGGSDKEEAYIILSLMDSLGKEKLQAIYNQT